MRRLLLSTMVAATFVALVFAQGKDELDYQKAVASGTVSALEKFVQKHPQSPLRTEAREKMAEIELNGAVVAGTPAAYRAVYQKYQSTRAGKEAQARAEELDFAEARKIDSPVAYAQFIRQNSDSSLVTDALRRACAGPSPRAEAEAALLNALELSVSNSPLFNRPGSAPFGKITMNGKGSMRFGEGDLEVKLSGPATLEYGLVNGDRKIVKAEYAMGSYFTRGGDLFWFDSTGWWVIRARLGGCSNQTQAQPQSLAQQTAVETREQPAESSPRDQPPRAPAPAPPQTPAAAAGKTKYTLKEGTPVKLVFAEDLSSKTAALNDAVTLVLSEDLRAGDAVVARAGARAVGTVANIKKAGAMGKGGKLDVRLESLIVGDAKVKLRGTRRGEGDTNGAAVPLTLIYGIGFFMHGKDAEVKQGTPLFAYVADDIDLPVVEERPASAQTPADKPMPVLAQTGESLDIAALSRGISEEHWVVTRNPSTGKVFVHRAQSGAALVDLRYVIEEGPGGTWTVFRASDRSHSVGVMKRPASLHVSTCSCR